MIKITVTFFVLISFSLNLFGQIPESIRYQTVIRDNASNKLENQSVNVRIRLLHGELPGLEVYAETFTTSTDLNGLITLLIGTGNTSDDFSSIDWSNPPYHIESSIDLYGGSDYSILGTTKIMILPYAFYAKSTDDDAVNDADADAGNELNLSLSVLFDSLVISDQGGDYAVDLSLLKDGVDDADTDPSNELQTLSRSGDNIILSNNGGSYMDSVNEYSPGSGISIDNMVISAGGCGLAIGDTFAGGFIIFLEPSGCHGLVCALSDQAVDVQWNSAPTYNTGAYSKSLYTGDVNTRLAANLLDPGLYAPLICDTLTVNGYDDWYLPSHDELYLLYNARRLGIPGFSYLSIYWSSTTDNNQYFAYEVNMANGRVQGVRKDEVNSVRAVRKF